MRKLEQFDIKTVSRKLNEINAEINLSHKRPFPKTKLRSQYKFQKKFVKISPNGDVEGGLCRMIISLIDFSFVRSLVSHCFSTKGRASYDPASIFLLDLFRYIDQLDSTSKLCELLRDKYRGRAYRTYAGITDNIPCEATFSNFRIRIGSALYNEIFHVLVHIFHQLNMITMDILSCDGTLYPSWARYKGCAHFCEGCNEITVKNIREKVRKRILDRLNKMDQKPIDSEIRIKELCPFAENFPKKVKCPSINLFSIKIAYAEGKLSDEQIINSVIFGVKEELEKQKLCIVSINKPNIKRIDGNYDTITLTCPKFSRDLDARVGVR